jgi:hypothetical protein
VRARRVASARCALNAELAHPRTPRAADGRHRRFPRSMLFLTKENDFAGEEQARSSGSGARSAHRLERTWRHTPLRRQLPLAAC